MKQLGRRVARAECVTRKRLKLLEKACLLCIILSWLGWSKVKGALMLIIYSIINSFIDPFGLGFSLPQPISDCVSCLVIFIRNI